MICEHKKPVLVFKRTEQHELEWNEEAGVWLASETPHKEDVELDGAWCGDCGEKIDEPDPWQWA